MAVHSLNSREREIVLHCLSAVNTLIDEWELEARLGISPEALRTIIESWPDVDDKDRNSNGYLAINNSLNEICHALALDEGSSLVGATSDEVKDVYRNWLRLRDIHGGIR